MVNTSEITADTPTADFLAAQLQRLPQKLFDQIYTATFTADKRTATNPQDGEPLCMIPDEKDTGVTINAAYKPPAQLQVPGGREQFAKSYYSNTAFTFRSETLLHKWLRALPLPHRRTLREVHCEFQELLEEEKSRMHELGFSRSWHKHAWNMVMTLAEDLDHYFPNCWRYIFHVRTWDDKDFMWWNGSSDSDSEPGGDEDDAEQDECGYDGECDDRSVFDPTDFIVK